MISDETRLCIETAIECSRLCNEAIQQLAQKEPELTSDTPLLRSLMDCAEICLTASGFLLRDSELSAKVCAVAAQVAERTARELDHTSDDLILARCREACRECAESCLTQITSQAA